MDDAGLILVLNNIGQWEDKTDDVSTCIAEPGRGQVRITYKTKPEHEYPYRHVQAWQGEEQPGPA